MRRLNDPCDAFDQVLSTLEALVAHFEIGFFVGVGLACAFEPVVFLFVDVFDSFVHDDSLEFLLGFFFLDEVFLSVFLFSLGAAGDDVHSD